MRQGYYWFILTILYRYDAVCHFTACCVCRITTRCTSNCTGYHFTGRKYIWNILSHSNTNDSCSEFHNWTAISGVPLIWSEYTSAVCRMAVYSALLRQTAIVWNQPKTSTNTVNIMSNAYMPIYVLKIT